MPYLNVDLAYFTHRKTIRLVGLLGRGAEVLPIKLWSYCGMHHAESGRLASYGPEEIETVAGWWGEKGRAVEAMLAVGFLEKDDEGNFQVHGWLEHAGHLAAFQKRAKTAAKERWARYASSIPISIAKSNAKQSPSRGKAQLGKVQISESGSGKDPESDPESERISVKDFVDSWNESFKNKLPSVLLPLSGSRQKKVAARLREHPTMEFWTTVFTNINSSAFLLGNGTGKGHESWRCTIDFVVANDTNCVKIFEGAYNRAQNSA